MANELIEKILTLYKGNSFDADFFECLLSRLGTLKITLGNDDVFLVSFSAAKVESTIKNKCNLSKVPEGLIYFAIERIAGEIMLAKYETGSLDEIYDFEMAVQQIVEGDTSITFANATGLTPEQRFLRLIEELTSYPEEELVCYRKLKW